MLCLRPQGCSLQLLCKWGRGGGVNLLDLLLSCQCVDGRGAGASRFVSLP